MATLNLEEHPHRRYNPLTGEWILVSPHRAKRPWQGKIEDHPPDTRPSYDPGCYLCPGNARAGGKQNPAYGSTFVFDNDFSALRPTTPPDTLDRKGLMVAKGERGICRVICFSPRHDVTLAEMQPSEIRGVVDVWADQFRELGARGDVSYVQIFENKGELMGCSNPHPHCQIWAEGSVPVEPAKETRQMKNYRRRTRHCLLCDYLKLERQLRDRIVLENETFSVIVPFWAVWPFETIVIPRRHLSSFNDFREPEREGLADVLKQIAVRYDNLFRMSFPYSAGFHQAPTNGRVHPEWHFHMHFYPPLLRSATVKKYMVGYEMLANAQRDITPELSARRLRELPEVHWRVKR